MKKRQGPFDAGWCAKRPETGPGAMGVGGELRIPLGRGGRVQLAGTSGCTRMPSERPA